MKTLVNAADIKALTTVSPNANDGKLSKTVPDAQQRHLRPLVGARLLAELLAFVEDAPESPSLTGLAAPAAAQATAAHAATLGAWRTAHAADPLLGLFDELRPCLAQWALVEAWPNLLVHIEEAGVLLKAGNAQGNTTADVATLNQVFTAHRATAVWRGDELVNWLEAHKNDFSAYQSTRPLATNRQPLDAFGGINV